MRVRFTIRDLLWLTLVVALAMGWRADRIAIQRWRAVHLEETKHARDLALQNWRIVRAKYDTGTAGGEPEREAQARKQYFFYREQLEQAAEAWLYFHLKTSAGGVMQNLDTLKNCKICHADM